MSWIVFFVEWYWVESDVGYHRWVELWVEPSVLPSAFVNCDFNASWKLIINELNWIESTWILVNPGESWKRFMCTHCNLTHWIRGFSILVIWHGGRMPVNKSTPFIWIIQQTWHIYIELSIGKQQDLFHFRDSHSASDSLISECNEDCGCSTTLYDPVCVDGIQYFTPCHAGCSQPAQIDDETGEKVLSPLFASIDIHM